MRRGQLDIFDKSFSEIMSSQLVATAIAIVAGAMLAVYTDKLLMIPGMLILIPGFLEMRGSINGTFASRLSSGLFLGVVKPNKLYTRITKGNMTASFILAILASVVLGFVAFFLNYLVFQSFTPKIIFLPLMAVAIASILEIPLTLAATFYIFNKGHDPNNIMGPFITSIGDLISVLSLAVVVAVI